MRDKTETESSKSTPFLGSATENSTARTEAPTLTAGRALDALVAEKVFGAKWNPVPTKAESGMDFRESEWLQFPPNGWILAQRFATGHVRASPPLKAYSGDIAAAWGVVEMLNRKGRWPQIQFGPNEDGFELWHVMLVNPVVEVAAPTAPEAICLAALKAVGA